MASDILIRSATLIFPHCGNILIIQTLSTHSLLERARFGNAFIRITQAVFTGCYFMKFFIWLLKQTKAEKTVNEGGIRLCLSPLKAWALKWPHLCIIQVLELSLNWCLLCGFPYPSGAHTKQQYTPTFVARRLSFCFAQSLAQTSSICEASISYGSIHHFREALDCRKPEWRPWTELESVQSVADGNKNIY